MVFQLYPHDIPFNYSDHIPVKNPYDMPSGMMNIFRT